MKSFGSPLAIENVADPVLGTGEVIVDVAASGVLAYANEVLSGARNYLLELPIVFGAGCVGRIRATGPDATPPVNALSALKARNARRIRHVVNLRGVPP